MIWGQEKLRLEMRVVYSVLRSICNLSLLQNLTPEAASPFPPNHSNTHTHSATIMWSDTKQRSKFTAIYGSVPSQLSSFQSLSIAAASSTVHTAQSCTCTIYKNLPGLKGRCGVFGYFTPVSGIIETHAIYFSSERGESLGMRIVCTSDLLPVSCPPTSTNKLVGGADCSA